MEELTRAEKIERRQRNERMRNQKFLARRMAGEAREQQRLRRIHEKSLRREAGKRSNGRI